LKEYIPKEAEDHEDFVKNAVVLTNNKSLTQLKELGDFCHQHNIVFIVADSYGLFANVFTDFGPSHKIFDTNGEENASAIVTLVARSKELTPEEKKNNVKPVTLVNTHDDKPHGLGIDDYIQFKEVQGMKEINYDPKTMTENHHLAAVRVSNVLGLYGFEIELDSSNFSNYKSNGLVTQVKVLQDLRSDSFRNSLDRPGEFIITDFAKFGRAEQYHFGYQAFLLFSERHHGTRPEIGNEEHIKEFLDIAKELNEKVKPLAEEEKKNSRT